MIPNRDNYDPTEFLDMNAVQPRFQEYNGTVAMILAVIADPNVKPEDTPAAIKDILRKVNRVGMALAIERIHSLATLGPELQHDCDGLDALCYCFGMHTVEQGEEAMRLIRQRFEEWEVAKHKEDEAYSAKIKAIDEKKTKAMMMVVVTPKHLQETVRVTIPDWHQLQIIGVLPHHFKKHVPLKKGDCFEVMVNLKAAAESDLRPFPILRKIDIEEA